MRIWDRWQWISHYPTRYSVYSTREVVYILQMIQVVHMVAVCPWQPRTKVTLLIILIVCWVLSVSTMKVLCPIMIHQPSRCQSRQYIEHLIKKSPNYVRNAVSKYATKCPLLKGRERAVMNSWYSWLGTRFSIQAGISPSPSFIPYYFSLAPPPPLKPFLLLSPYILKITFFPTTV